jgi:hypothetical protein
MNDQMLKVRTILKNIHNPFPLPKPCFRVIIAEAYLQLGQIGKHRHRNIVRAYLDEHKKSLIHTYTIKKD